MIGFHDHINDPRSGRPEPHYSWQGERLKTWLAWVTGGSLLLLSLYDYAKWRDVAGAAQILVVALIFAATGYLRGRALDRKKVALRIAVADHDDQLAKVFHETDAS